MCPRTSGPTLSTRPQSPVAETPTATSPTIRPTLRETEKEMGEIKIDINMIKMVNIDIDTEIEMEIKS